MNAFCNRSPQPEKRRSSHQANRKQPRKFDRHLYGARHLIENFFAKLKQYRAIATRYDKTSRNFLAAVFLAASVIWLN
jgi:transposase